MTRLMYAYYTTMGFMPTFLQNYVKLERPDVATLMIVATSTSLVGQIFTGFLSQRLGRKKTIAIFAAAAIIIAVPAIFGLYIAATLFENFSD